MSQLATINEAGNYLCAAHAEEFAKIYSGDHKKAQSFLALCLAAIQKEPKLLLCERTSVRDALLEAAHVDLAPGNAMSQSFLIPYGRQCQLQIGYRGLAELVQREGAVKKVWANVVYEDEVRAGKFVVESGSEHRLYHSRDPFREDPASWEGLLEADLVGAYACAELASGAVNFETVGLDTLKRARVMSSSPAWKNWASEMVKKFPLKRLCKRLPKTKSIEAWRILDEKHGLRDAVQLADDALGDTTVDIPPPENERELTNQKIKIAWMELRGEDDKIAALEMDRELEDYLLPERTSDAEAHHFLDKMLGALS